jgi:cellulose synthase operon protein B
MAIMAGQPISFELTGVTPPKGSGSVLVVGGANMLDASYMKAAGVDPQAVQKAWAGRFDVAAKPPKDEALSRYEAVARNRLVLERNFPAACRMPKPPGGFERAVNTAWRRVDPTATATIAQNRTRQSISLDGSPVSALQVTGNASGALYDEWNAKVRNQGAFGAYAAHVFTNVKSWVGSKVSSVIEWFGATIVSGPPAPQITARTSLVVAQNILGDSADDVWMLIMAPTSADLAESVPCLVDPRVWGQIAGRLSLLDASEGTVQSAPADAQRLIVTQPLTVENSRLIAAGWLSLNSQVYVALALFIAVLLALTTTFFVRNVGRRHEG